MRVAIHLIRISPRRRHCRRQHRQRLESDRNRSFQHADQSGWTDNSNNEDGFRIERCQDAGCSTFVEIATVGAGVTSYNNTGLVASTTYRYQVRAFNAGGNSPYSNISPATTTPPPAPAAPSRTDGDSISSRRSIWRGRTIPAMRMGSGSSVVRGRVARTLRRSRRWPRT